MKSRQILQFISSQFIAITVGVLDQFSIVDCDAVVFLEHNFTRLDLLLATVFSTRIRERITWIGIYLVDMLLNGPVPNSSIEYLPRHVSCSDFQETL